MNTLSRTGTTVAAASGSASRSGLPTTSRSPTSARYRGFDQLVDVIRSAQHADGGRRLHEQRSQPGPLALGLGQRALLARLQGQPLLLVAVALDCGRHRVGDGRQQVDGRPGPGTRARRADGAHHAAVRRPAAARRTPSAPGRAASRGRWRVPTPARLRTSEASAAPGPPADGQQLPACVGPVRRPDPDRRAVQLAAQRLGTPGELRVESQAAGQRRAHVGAQPRAAGAAPLLGVGARRRQDCPDLVGRQVQKSAYDGLNARRGLVPTTRNAGIPARPSGTTTARRLGSAQTPPGR